ncbi:hypothetical protein DCAR_0103612 [Daucus carota subsp. sativus]|uniref:Uncharacterized protein n=1 Tax=Daucus carota subsp. sativus TaxID=79200 RepID=A0A166I4W4_DAUCS|nr:hypothetical protein DCAR_0103612 [Daucus carota subsp. sativus]
MPAKQEPFAVQTTFVTLKKSQWPTVTIQELLDTELSTQEEVMRFQFEVDFFKYEVRLVPKIGYGCPLTLLPLNRYRYTDTVKDDTAKAALMSNGLLAFPLRALLQALPIAKSGAP